MSNDHLRRDPHKIYGTQTAWWYEEPAGITIVQEVHGGQPDGPLLATLQETIPWWSIREALARKDQQ